MSSTFAALDSRPLRIALISEHASPLADIGSVDAGGQNVYVSHVARGLARLGHEVDVFTRRDAAELPASVDVCPGMRVLHIDAGPATFVPKERLLPHMSAFAQAARQVVRHSVPYDVAHANFFMSGLVGLQLQAVFGMPLVTTFHALGLVRREHQGAADGFPAQRCEIERRIVQRSDRLVAECPQDEQDLVRLYGADPQRIATVPCGVDLNEFGPGSRQAARRALGIGDDEFIVLQLGRLVPRKGVDTVIESLAALRDGLRAANPARRVRLLVVGGESVEPCERATPEIARLRRVARERGVADLVTFIGKRARHQLRDFYVACDAFVSTPWYEPFGITPLEAMACGRPVVGSAVGGIRHTVVDRVTGLLVPSRDPQALAQRLLHLALNPALAAAMGRAGIRRVRSMFTWDRVAAQLADVYAGVAAPLAQPVAGRGTLRVAGPSSASSGAVVPLASAAAVRQLHLVGGAGASLQPHVSPADRTVPAEARA